MEKDKPHNVMILVYLLGICLGIAGTVIFVYEYFRADVRKEYEKKVLASPNNALRDTRAREDGRLGKYQWVDQGRGIVRVPLDRARELVLKEWEARPAGVVPVVPADGAGAAPVTPGVPPVDGAAPVAPGVPPVDGAAPGAPAPAGGAAPAPAGAPAPAPAAPTPAPAPAGAPR